MNYKRIPLGPLWTNSYVVDDGRGTALCFDAGGDPADVLGWLRNEQLKLAAIVLTHGHMDHILGVAPLARATGAAVYVPENDEALLRDPNMNLAAEFGYSVEPVAADHIVRDGDVFTFGELKVEALHTPGHTPGSVTYRIGDALLTGDTMFQGSYGRTDFPGGSWEQEMNSIRKLLALPEDHPVYPGHGPQTTLAAERPFY